MRKIVFLIMCCCNLLFAVTNDFIAKEDAEEDILLGETLHDKLQTGYGLHLYLSGLAHCTGTLINQSVSNDKDGQIFSFQGNIDLRLHKKADGYGYGFEVCTKENSGIIKQGNPIFDTTYIFLETDNIGEIRLGYTNTAADEFTIAGDKLFVGYEGPGSCNLESFYNQSAGSTICTGSKIDDNKAAKIAWYSPVIRGFSAGVSFTPDSKYAHTFSQSNKCIGCDNNGRYDFASDSAHSKNIITLAGKYEYGSQKAFNAAVSVLGWFGKGDSGVKGFDVHNVRAFGIGGLLGYKNFKISAGYINNGKSLLPKVNAVGDATPFDETATYELKDNVGIKSGANAGEVYMYGASYDFGKLKTYGGYYRSVVKFSFNEKATADIITAGAEYQFTKAVSAYFEYDNINTDTCDRARAYKKACDGPSTGKNRANMFMIGTKFRF